MSKEKIAIAVLHVLEVDVGVFDDEIEAALAYDRMAEELFGEFAYLNFPCPRDLPAQAGSGDRR